MVGYPYARRRCAPRFLAAIAAFMLPAGAYIAASGNAEAQVSCGNTITANVVVLDNPTVFNRLGAQNPNWITYALERDVVVANRLNSNDPANGTPCSQTTCTAGNVELRPDKRTRPLVVRSIAGSCLTVNFTNLLAPAANPNNAQQDALFNDDQVAGRCAGFHASGTEVVDNIADDGSMVGSNPGANIGDSTNGPAAAVCGPGLAEPGGTRVYNLHTPHEGAFVINSYGAVLGSEQSSGNLGIGMFGQLNVEPTGAKMYRSQVTEEELRLATVGRTPLGQPIINYEARYPVSSPWKEEGKGDLPILNMLNGNELVHSDINAIIVGPNLDGTFPPSTYPLESVNKKNPQLPNRLEPFREFTSVFHDEQTNSQVFPRWYGDPVLSYTLAGVKDQFMINYGSGGIGSEIIANRLHTGPMHDCTDCAYEEFFLASQTVGDPGGLVNFPANTMIEQCDPTNILTPACWRQFNDPVHGPVGANPPIPGNFALFQEDPGNIHHSYTGDFVKIRNTHTGAFEQHIFHLHNHQWLFNPNDDNSNYMDAQEIMPGSGHTYELVNGGAGNRNKTAGDAIFHCHFYPHFAQGMWYHIRIQDTFEEGSLLAVSTADGDHAGDKDADGDGFHDRPFALRSGQPAAGARALPDGELPDGWPIPAIVPMPGKPMPEMPAKVSVVAVDRGDFGVLSGRRPPNGLGQGPDSAQAVVDFADVAGPDGQLGTADDKNPGFPFWLAGNSCGVPNATATNCPQGTVGQRMPTPPLDMLTEAGAAPAGYNSNQAGGWDGGLPRHNLLGYTAGGVSLDTQNRLDFRKVVEIAQPVYFPEVGTDLEQVAMAYHGVRNRSSYANNLANDDFTAGDFILNGAPDVPGAPFNEPCIDDQGKLLEAGVSGRWFDGDNNPVLSTRGTSNFDAANPRTYKIANVQIDAVFNKVGYHYPQERIIALWEDVQNTIDKLRPPEPLVMRFNTFDCGKILHTNLVPEEFELDDFQVRTPTDIIGQHIHLPKWDLTTNDGAANGWNYEDGSLSPGIVDERIHAINNFNKLAGSSQSLVQILTDLGIAGDLNPLLVDAVSNHQVDLSDLAPVPTIDTGDDGSQVPVGATELRALPHPFFGAGLDGEYLGARTTIQRILMDPVVNVKGEDRGLGLTFSHDHYGPSTFQQIGLYSTILAEPAGSKWVHNESGTPLGDRHDGGPTSWQAAILTPASRPRGSNVKSEDIPSHREFYFEMSDFQHAYEKGEYVGAGPDGRPIHAEIIQPDPFNVTVADAPALNDTWRRTVNPPLKLKSVPFPDVVTAEGACPGPAGNFDPNVPRPCAEAINISHSSMFVVNYRNEPVGLRVFDPRGLGPDGKRGTQAQGKAGDLAFALQSRTDRKIAQLNRRFGDTPQGWRNAPYCRGDDDDKDTDDRGRLLGNVNRTTGDLINCDRRRGDPFTPIMRAYERDNVKVKIQVGATEEQHQTTIHGLKWLSNGSGFGKSGNSGWRNFQSHGISEQFALQTALNPDPGQRGNTVDYLYATDATRDGFWTGPWGLLRTYGYFRPDLFQLPDNLQRGKGSKVIVTNQADFNGVCPKTARVTSYEVAAVLANDVLPNRLRVTIPGNAGGDSDGDGIGDNVGGPLNTAGGTLVYNRRGTVVPDIVVPAEGAEPGGVLQGGEGPLNDPTAMMYVYVNDLVPNPQTQQETARCNRFGPADRRCPVKLHGNAPVEPLVLRANAGDCIEVTLHNRLPDVAPDLAGWQDMMWVVNRDLFNPVRPPEMHFFNNNLIRPSSHVGLHAQLVEYDASRDDGLIVGKNRPISHPVAPGGKKTYRWYAGALIEKWMDENATTARRANLVELVAKPVEYGGTNLLSTDRVKQPQKGLFGALVIEPRGSNYPKNRGGLEKVADGQGRNQQTRKTRAQVTVKAPKRAAGSGGTYREALAIGHKITNLRWKDGSAIANIHQGELGREGAEDSGHAGFNYGMEPSWFRFKLPPDAPFGNAGTDNSFGNIPNVQAFYANALVAAEPNAIPRIAEPDGTVISKAGDPATPVFRATATPVDPNTAEFDTRIHVLNGASADRDGTFILHGHVWQRDPFVCANQSNLGLEGRCNPNNPVPSRNLGLNKQAKYMGGEEGMGHAYAHWPILFDAGGSGAVDGDYLFRDYAPNGNRNGQFGILRVDLPAQ